jgi:nitrogen fixation protein FixH
MSARTKAVEAKQRALTGWHVLFMLLGFFGLVFAVNGYFLASALRTYTGVVSVEPYVKGLHYNDRISAGERQSKLGWTESVSVTSDGAVRLAIADDGGRPVRGVKLTATIGRPATNRLDRTLALVESEPGQYVAQVGPLDDGTWLFSVEGVSRDYGEEPVYRMRRRVCLKC